MQANSAEGTVGGKAKVHNLDQSASTTFTTELRKVHHHVLQLDVTQRHAGPVKLIQALQKGRPQQVMRAGQGGAAI